MTGDMAVNIPSEAETTTSVKDRMRILTNIKPFSLELLRMI